MGDFSTSPEGLLAASRDKDYVGLHVEQGVPLLDRDLNLLQDLIVAEVRDLFSRFVGDGVPSSEGFAIGPAATGDHPEGNFVVHAGTSGGPGSLLISGLQFRIPAPVQYVQQAGVPPLTVPSAGDPDPRVDTVYLDGWVDEVDGRADPDLTNSVDVGMQTSVRLQVRWVVRVAENQAAPPPAAPGHLVYPLATLTRPHSSPAIDATMISDLRQRRLTVAELENRLALVERVLLLPRFGSPEFVPLTGIVNQAVTLNGANFDIGDVTVLFGDKPADLVGAPSATQVVARVPGGLTPGGTATAVRLTIRTDGGEAVSEGTFGVLVTPTFADPGNQFEPTHGAPGTRITLHGFNFNVGSPQVTFAARSANVIQTTATTMVVEVPVGLVPPGSTTADVQITVTTEAGFDTSDDTFRAELNIPAPAFATPPNAQFTPQSGTTGQTVTLNGTNFNFVPVSVRFNDKAANIMATPSATQIVVVVPPGLAVPLTSVQAHITVTTLGGSVTSTQVFLVQG